MGSGEPNNLHLARHYLEMGRQQAALDVLSSATSDDLEDATYWEMRSQALAELGRNDESAQAAERGLARHPEDIGLLDSFAIAESQRGFHARAAKALAKALELDPQNPLLLAHRGFILAQTKEVDEARAAIAEAMKLAPEWKPVLQTRAQVAVLTKDKQAGQYIEELLRADPNDRVAHALRGALASEKKRYVSASRAFDEAARLDPGDAELVEVAREARVAAHPILAPARAMWRIGRWRAYFMFLIVTGILAATGFESAREVIIYGWLVIVFLSWFGPGLVRRHQKRKYGGF
jgi:Flp pilus assembly protein TadD